MWEQDSVILDQSDLPGDVLEDIYQLRDFSGFIGNDEQLIGYYEMLERKAVFDVITRNLSIYEELVTKLTVNYGKIKEQLLACQFGYSVLLNENPDLFERSMRLCTTKMQGASDLMEMAALLRRMILYHQEYYYELFGVFLQTKQHKNDRS